MCLFCTFTMFVCRPCSPCVGPVQNVCVPSVFAVCWHRSECVCVSPVFAEFWPTFRMCWSRSQCVGSAHAWLNPCLQCVGPVHNVHKVLAPFATWRPYVVSAALHFRDLQPCNLERKGLYFGAMPSRSLSMRYWRQWIIMLLFRRFRVDLSVTDIVEEIQFLMMFETSSEDEEEQRRCGARS